MGKEFHEQAADDVEFESYDHDGTDCMGDIFDYHQWYNVKKIFRHRKYNRGSHGRCCVNPRTISMERVIETQGLLRAEADHLQKTIKTGSTTDKSSNKASTKASTNKEKHKQWIPGFSATPKLHHFEYSGFDFGWINPIILISKRDHVSYSSSTSSRADTLGSKKQDIHDRMNFSQHAKKLGKQGLDDLELFKVNKDLLVDIFQDPGVGVSHHLARKQTSEAVKLMRSGSFPVRGSPCTWYLQFSTLEHKQKEVWSFRQGEKSVAGTQSSQGSDSQRMRRTKSINESLNRYTKLFEHDVSKEADLYHSKSLKLSKEGQVPSRELHGLKIFRSISSLSDNDSFRSLLHAVSCDGPSFEVPIGSILNYDENKENDEHNEPKIITIHEGIDKFELVEAVMEAELQEKMREGISHDSSSTNLLIDINGEHIAKPSDLMEKMGPRQEQESAFGDNPSKDLTRKTSEGPALNHQNLPECEVETFTFSKEKATMLFEYDKEDDPSYNYVINILELSGFLQNKCLHSWYSPDQPLNPSLFKELETLLHPRLECSSIDESGTNCDNDQRLVFDLVNEALVEISEKTAIYFTKPLSCRIGLMFNGNIVLREVWRKVSRNLAFQLKHDQSLDDIVDRDMEKDAWMIFQSQAESVALELEDLVFDELLDGLFCL
ncbi:Detected protein of unknown function [Hibiscus syriacus]|uniref:DUF4378 domain-containing protein n=1 Tax=Hibiscus syriacus TaxID=106335 RepID=A0A6A3CKU2_HIBSY|nr:Detected protein of unknown function [Hibiscus syriacus]